MKVKARPARRGRRGVVSAEFALVTALVLLPVVLGCIDLGRFGYHYIAVTNSARAAAGFAMMNTYTAGTQSGYSSKIQQAAADEMSGQTGYVSSNLTTTVTLIDEGSGDLRVQVNATYPFKTLITWPGIPSTLNLQRTVAMRKIR